MEEGLVYLIFLGSQTCFFFLTTAPQSLQRKRPDFALAVDFPSLQFEPMDGHDTTAEPGPSQSYSRPRPPPRRSHIVAGPVVPVYRGALNELNSSLCERVGGMQIPEWYTGTDQTGKVAAGIERVIERTIE